MESRIFKLNEIAVGNNEQATKTPFYSTDSTSGVIWVVKPGQKVPTHMHTTSDDVWICMQGKGIFYPEQGKEIEISKGDIIVSAKNEHHGMLNTGDEDFIFIGIVAPTPSDFHPL